VNSKSTSAGYKYGRSKSGEAAKGAAALARCFVSILVVTIWTDVVVLDGLFSGSDGC
jgi:hypothetical protein